ncbi:MAG: pyruvate kinase [Erysipelotrichales bacterium]|nr:pyruvate kinase [Erysipelotrichales bacterium]
MMVNRKTKIICTLGPASNTPEMLGKMIDAGMDVARLNFSHATHEEHLARIEMLRKVVKEKDANVGILLDTKGPEIRCGLMENDCVHFNEGDIVRVVRDEVLGNHERFQIIVPELFDDVKPDQYLLIDDGKMRLTILEVNDGELVCKVENPGPIKSRKGVNVPNVKLSMPFLSAKDEADIRFACKHDLDYIAASFTRRAEDVRAIRRILEEEGKKSIQIIAKIENQEGYDNLNEILDVADGIMVARGDLGVEVSIALVPIYQKNIIRICNERGKFVITATHMLESMQQNPRPTRAEASDVANAVIDGSDAIMLSGESAAGNYPVEAILTMNLIATTIEDEVYPYEEKFNKAVKSAENTKMDSVALSVAETALNLDVAGIVAFTDSGTTAKRVAKFRPKAPIIAVTPLEDTKRKLSAVWGLNPTVDTTVMTLDTMDEKAINAAKAFGIDAGETIIVVVGYPSASGKTNTLRIIEVE